MVFNLFCFIWFFGLLLVNILQSDFFKLTNLYKSVIFLAAQELWLSSFAFFAFQGHTFPLIKAIYCFFARTWCDEEFCQWFTDITNLLCLHQYWFKEKLAIQTQLAEAKWKLFFSRVCYKKWSKRKHFSKRNCIAFLNYFSLDQSNWVCHHATMRLEARYSCPCLFLCLSIFINSWERLPYFSMYFLLLIWTIFLPFLPSVKVVQFW